MIISNVIDFSKISPHMALGFTNKGDILAINTIQNECFITSINFLPLFYDGRAIYKRDNGYFAKTVDASGDAKKGFHQLAMEDEVQRYRDTYGIEPVVDHINRDRTDNRSCNLRVISSRANVLNSDCIDPNSYYGVTKVSDKTYMMSIADPRNKIRIKETYETEEDAAKAYDYYVSIYYPEEEVFSNVGANKYPKGYLESNGINSIFDIKLPKSKRSKKDNFTTNYYGIYHEGLKNYKYEAKVQDINERGEYGVAYCTESKDLPNIIAKREEYLLDHPEISKGNSNIAYHRPKKGKTTIAGIIVTKDEDHILKPNK